MTRTTRRRGNVSFVLVAILAGAAILASPWVRDRADELAGWGWGQPSLPVTAEPSASTADGVRALETLTVVPERPDIPGYQRGCGPEEACSFGPAWTDGSAAPDAMTAAGPALSGSSVCRRDDSPSSAGISMVEAGCCHVSDDRQLSHGWADGDYRVEVLAGRVVDLPVLGRRR